MTTGPISESASRPGPTFTLRAFSATAAISSSPAEPTLTAAEMAMHRSPADPNAAATKWSEAKSIAASGSTIAWVFAPPRACTRLPCAVPVS